MTIFLVRHGETIDNASHTFQVPDSPLSNNGNVQAEQLSERLMDEGISDIVCSDYLRTQETASYTAKRLGIKPQLVALLRERNFGDIRGRPYAELGFDPFALDYQPVNGENWQTFDARVAQAWQAVKLHDQMANGNLLVITHGFVCRSIVANHAALDQDIEIPTRWGNTSVTKIRSTSPWPVIRLNCTQHLGNDLSTTTGSAGQV